MHDLIILGGRVIDPETGRDETADVAVADGRIVAVGRDLGPAARAIDAGGLVVAPGFIDLHAHGQSLPADRMQAFDGVTTALELELGALPVARWYDEQAHAGRLLNYGASVGWVFARVAAMTAQQVEPGLEGMGRAMRDRRWADIVASPAELADIVTRVQDGLDQGGIGIGFPNAYAPGAGVKEMSLLCSLAAERGTPTFTHVAYMSNIDPQSSVDAYTRLIELAGSTGAHMHICHFNATSLLDVERAAELVRTAQRQGLNVTVEAYPYGTGSTVVGAAFFADPAFPERTGRDYSSVELVQTGRPFADRGELLAAQGDDPGAIVLWHFLDVAVNERHRDLLDVSVLFPGGAIASDAIPWTLNGVTYTGADWPLPDGAVSHPRSSGTFTRFLRQWVRERQAVPLIEGLRKCTLNSRQHPGSQHPAHAAQGPAATRLRCGHCGLRLRQPDGARRVHRHEPGGGGHAARAGQRRGGHRGRRPGPRGAAGPTGAAARERMTVPILMVTGALGAGKTTLVNHLLAEPQGRRLAVVVNDFGAIDIDAQLLAGLTDGVVSLKNGCVCCSLQGDLLATLSTLLRRDPAPDAIVIETSGVSDPAEIVRALLDPVIWHAAALDAVVCVADARHLADQPDLPDDTLWRSQLRAADFVALTKTELLDGAEHAQVRADLRRLKPDRVVHESQFGRMPPELLFSAHLHQPASSAPPRIMSATPGYQTVSWTAPSALAADRFRSTIERFAGRLVRAKGFVRFAHAPERPMLFQLVGQRATVGPAPPNVPANTPTQIVFIAKDNALNEADITNDLRGCVAVTSNA